MTTQVSEFFKLRQQLVVENKKQVQQLKLDQQADLLKKSLSVPKQIKKPKRNPDDTNYTQRTILQHFPPRKSNRLSGKEAPTFEGLDQNDDELRPMIFSQDKVEMLRNQIACSQERQRKRTSTNIKPRVAYDSGRGVRYQGGRLYDSAKGETCHWCRQKTLEDKVRCTRPNCGAGGRAAVVFCGMCLKNRHGEDLQQAINSGCWVCPRCRGSCGEGCDTCCNCSFCRLRVNLQPTGNCKKHVLAAGFDNAHDWLIHIKTGLSKEAITARKLQHSWGAFLQVQNTTDGEDSQEEEEEEGEHVRIRLNRKARNVNDEVDEEEDSENKSEDVVMSEGDEDSIVEQQPDAEEQLQKPIAVVKINKQTCGIKKAALEASKLPPRVTRRSAANVVVGRQIISQQNSSSDSDSQIAQIVLPAAGVKTKRVGRPRKTRTLTVTQQAGDDLQGSTFVKQVADNRKRVKVEKNSGGSSGGSSQSTDDVVEDTLRPGDAKVELNGGKEMDLAAFMDAAKKAVFYDSD